MNTTTNFRKLIMLTTFLALLLAAGVSAFVHLSSVLSMAPSEAPYEGVATPMAHDPEKPTAVILVSNQGTEVTDLMGPYQLLKMSGIFNVYTAAPELKPVGLNGGIDLLPHTESPLVC